MAEETPFQHFFATLGQGSAHHSADVNPEAAARLEQVLKSPVDGPGRGILLRAPRAGFGKTHLIARTQYQLSSTHEFLPLTLLDGACLDPSAAIESVLRRLTRQLPAGGGLTALDLQTRRILALALQPLVSSGEVPCQDREAALSALRQRPVETFDFHQPQAITAHWTRENFEILGPRLALELSRLSGSSMNETSFWLAALFRFAVAVPENPGRSGMIIQSATADGGVERFAALLALLSLIMRVVLVADDLEGLHADPSAALRLGSFLASVRQDAPRVDAIVSVNDDIWSSSFEPALSGGLQDRLGEIEIRLGPLDERAAVALLDDRVPGRGEELFRKLSPAHGEWYSRKLLRLAAERLASLSAAAAEPGDAPPLSSSEVDSEEPAPASVPEVPLTTPATDAVETPAAVPASPFSIPQPAVQPAEAVASPASSFAEAPPEVAPVREQAEEPVAAAVLQVAENEMPEEAAGGDRIDDLLRQFRDRYGRD